MLVLLNYLDGMQPRRTIQQYIADPARTHPLLGEMFVQQFFHVLSGYSFRALRIIFFGLHD